MIAAVKARPGCHPMPRMAPTNRLEAASNPWVRAVKGTLIGEIHRVVSRLLQNVTIPGKLKPRILLVF
jgi:hypothetical protein